MNLSEIKITPIKESLQILDISDEVYFGPKYKKYISNSSLSLINPAQGGSPQIYYEGLSAHPKFSDSLHFGNAVHCMTLQSSDYFIVDQVDRPTAKAGFMADELYKEWCETGKVSWDSLIRASNKIDYYKDKMDSKKFDALLEKIIPYFEERNKFEQTEFSDAFPIYLDPKSRDKLKRCLESLTNNSDIQRLLHPKGLIEDPKVNNEVCILLDVKAIYPDGEEKILSLKAKIDSYYFDEETGELVINDLKTTGHDVQEFVNSFYKFHYYRQFGFYAWLLYLIYGADKINSMKANVMISSTIPPFNSGVFTVLNTHIRRGMDEFKELLKRVAYHEHYGYDIEPPDL